MKTAKTKNNIAQPCQVATIDFKEEKRFYFSFVSVTIAQITLVEVGIVNVRGSLTLIMSFPVNTLNSKSCLRSSNLNWWVRSQ
jgi:hypothetical protein